MQQMDDFPFKDQGRFWLLFLILSFGLLWLLSAVLAPFITGLALAYLLDPLVRKISSLRTPRSLASVIVLLLFFILFIGLIVFISPIIARQAVEFFNNIPTYVEHFRSAITPYFQKLLGSLSPEDVQKIQDAASGHIGSVLNGAQKIFLRVWSGGMAVIDVVTFVVITPIVAFYCMRDWEVIVERIHALFPRQSAQTMKKLLADFDSRLSGFLRGQLLVCLCLGAFYGLALSVLGLNFGLAIGTITGILSFIPYIGSSLGFITSVGVALVQYDSPHQAAIIAGVFILGQFVEGNFLTPKLVGERVGLHPVWVIFALMAGGNLLGMTGMLLAVPIAAMIGVTIRFAIHWYQLSPIYLGKNG